MFADTNKQLQVKSSCLGQAIVKYFYKGTARYYNSEKLWLTQCGSL